MEETRIIPFRVFDRQEKSRESFDTDIATAIDRAVLKGARIINMSLGGPVRTQKIVDAIKGSANNANGQTAMVASAGNKSCGQVGATPSPTPDPFGTPMPAATPTPPGDTHPIEPTPPPATESVLGGANPDDHNVDQDPQYPGSLEFPNLISVANTNEQDALDCLSKYGAYTVDLAAPGTNIVSTLNKQSALDGRSYDKLTGTSFSAPHVSGTLALIRETFPNSTVFELLDRVRMSVDERPSLLEPPPEGEPAATPGALRDFTGRVSTGGRLNAYRALLPRAKLANVSSRAQVETDDRIAINGFILRAATRVVIRGLGPSLAVNNVPVPGRMADPYLELFQNGIRLAVNDNWRTSQQAEIQAHRPRPSKRSGGGHRGRSEPGAYTIHLSGVNRTQGIGLNEVFELSSVADPAAPPDAVKDLQRTVNLSTRVMVRGNDQIAIVGVIVEGRGIGFTPPPLRRVIIRALGPSLAASGVGGFLNDPKLELFNSDGELIAQNDFWRSFTQRQGFTGTRSRQLAAPPPPIKKRSSSRRSSRGLTLFTAVVPTAGRESR